MRFYQVETQTKLPAISCQQPARHQYQERIFQQFVADENHARAATAIEFHRAERDGQRRLNGQGAMKHQRREWHQHHHQRQSCPTHRDAGQQQQSAKSFKPRQGRGNRIQRQGILHKVVLPHQLQKIHGMQRLAQAGVKKNRAQQPPHQHGGEIQSDAIPVCLTGIHLPGLRRFPLFRPPDSTGRPLVAHSVIPPP